MRKLKLFFACLLMAVLSIGQVWAVDPEVFDFTEGTYSGSNADAIITWTGTSCTIVQSKGESTSNVNSSYAGTNLRWYASHYVTFTPKTNITITKVVMVGKSGKTGQTMTKTSASGNATITTTASTYTTEVTGSWTSSSPLELKMGSQFQLTSVTITYSTGGSTPPSTPVDPTITFNNAKLVVGKSLDLSTLFTSNSTGTVTYSIKSGGSYASLSGSTLTGVAPGTVTIQASQAATTGYNTKNAEATITVVKAISFDFEPNTAHRTSGSNTYDAGGNTYTQNSTDDISCTYMDVVTSGTPLSGSANASGRVAKNTTNSPVLVLGPISLAGKKITGVSYLTKGVSAMSQVCSYSLDNSTWTGIKTISSMPTQATEESVGNLNITGTDLYLKIATTVASSTGSNRDLQIDNILLTYEDLKYTVSFDANGGTGTMSDIENIIYNASQVIPANSFSRTGYTFQGWATSGEGSKVYDNNGTIQHVTSDITLYAVWSANSYSIILDKNGGDSDGAASIHYDASDLTITSNASWAAHNLLGYFTATEGGVKVIDADGSLISDVANYTSNAGKWIKAEDCTLHAQWETVSNYSISYGDLVGCTADGGNATDFAVDASSVTLNFNLGEERTWNGATISVSMGGSPMSVDDYDLDNGELTIMPTTFTGNLVVAITAPVKTYTVLIGANDNTYGSAVFVVNEVETDNVEVTKSATTTIKATANTGYQFVNWSTEDNVTIANVNDAQTTISAVSEDATITANFSALPTAVLTLIDQGNPHAESGVAHAITIPFNLPSAASECSKTFVGWDSNSNCTSAPQYAKGAEFTFANTTGVTLYAVYADGGATNHTITKTTSGIVSENSYTVSQNQNVTCYTNLTLDDNISLSTTGSANCGSFWGDSREWRLYQAQGGNAIVTASNGCTLTSVKFTYSVTQSGILLNGSETMTSGTAVEASGSSATYTVDDTDNTQDKGQVRITAVEVKYSMPGSYSNYSTTCANAPVATPSQTALSNIAAAGTSGTITMTYENVNTGNVEVSVWSNEACTEAIEGNWLSATLNDDKNIEYSIAEYNSYASDRSAYIKLTAPETNGATAPAIVKIPVSQVKKDAVFTSLEDLALSDVPANTNVTVSFSNVPIKSIYYYPDNTSENYRKGVVFDIQKAGQDIKIYYNAKVSEDWVAGGKLSGTLTDCPWKIYGGGWQLAPTGEWGWNNLTYTAPPAIDHIEIRGSATYKTYIDGQVFDPAGLSVIAIYDNNDEEDVTAYSTWTYTPATLSEDDTEVEVTAEYNSESDSETVTGLTVNPIPNKTIAQFIAAGGTRCYLEGTVSNYTNTTKGYFDLTDASGTIYVYGCTSPSSFAAGDKIKVIAEEYLLYGTPAKDEAKNVVFVSKISPVEITISDKNLYVNDTWTIEATTDPAAAVANISYSIKTGSDACIDETELASGVVKAIAEGDATIIATIPDGDGYLENSVEFEVHVSPAIVRTGIYAKVTSDEELTDGEYLIVYETDNLAFDGSLETLNVSGNSFEVTIDNGKIIATAEIDAKSFTITNGTIKSASGKFIGKEADSNGMDEGATAYTNTLSIVSNNFEVVGSGGAHLRYNSSSDVFRYYKSSTYTGQKAIQLYRKMDYTRAVSGNYGTICLPKAGVLTNGALYEIAEMDYQDNKPYKIYFDEVEGGVMEAGKPYIFKPNDGVTVLRVVYTDAADAAEGNYNGLYGKYTKTKLAKDAGNYILKNNQYYYVNSDNVYCEANRAYIVLDEVPEFDNTKPAYGRRRIALNVNNEQVATGMDELNASEAPVKVMIDGQLFILRGEKMYDATGRLVK